MQTHHVRRGPCYEHHNEQCPPAHNFPSYTPARSPHTLSRRARSIALVTHGIAIDPPLSSRVPRP
eukprot:572206-Prymnesium_polylepis.2